MKKIKQILVGLVAVVIAGCASVSLEQVHQELAPATQVVRDIAVVLQPTDPELSTDLQKVAMIADSLDQTVVAMLEGGASNLDVFESVELLLTITQPYIEDPKTQAEVQAAIIALRYAAEKIKVQVE